MTDQEVRPVVETPAAPAEPEFPPLSESIKNFAVVSYEEFIAPSVQQAGEAVRAHVNEHIYSGTARGLMYELLSDGANFIRQGIHKGRAKTN